MAVEIYFEYWVIETVGNSYQLSLQVIITSQSISPQVITV